MEGYIVCLLCFFIPVNNFFSYFSKAVGSSWVEPTCILNKGLMCLDQRRNTVAPVRFELATPVGRVYFKIKGCWWYSNSKRTFCEQTVETLIRCRFGSELSAFVSQKGRYEYMDHLK